MNIRFEKELCPVDLLIIPLAVGEKLPLDIQAPNFQGTKGEVAELPGVILIGIGDSPLSSLEWQEIGGEISQYLKGKKIGIIAKSPSDLAFGLKLRSWRFTKYMTNRPSEDREIIFFGEAPDAAKDSLYRGVVMARELTVEPANHLYPDAFAKRCLELEKLGVAVQVFDEKALEEMGAETILSVGKSSVHPPRMVVMQWNGGGDAPYIALVGKGVCFDSGGINLKTAELVEMKFDKAAAAAVTGVLLTLAEQKVPLNVVGVIGLAENMVDGASMRPGDIITTLSGKTVEVVNTDYEGRLVLADCLWYVQEKFHPSLIIDLGTLTPETVAPLADEYAGLYCEDKELTASLVHAGLKSGEKVWHLPMGPKFAKQLISEYADIKNMGMPGFGEGGAAAEFLKHFIQPNVRWAHLDIAGVAWTHDHCPFNGKGITGFGVRLLMEWLMKY